MGNQASTTKHWCMEMDIPCHGLNKEKYILQEPQGSPGSPGPTGCVGADGIETVVIGDYKYTVKVKERRVVKSQPCTCEINQDHESHHYKCEDGEELPHQDDHPKNRHPNIRGMMLAAFVGTSVGLVATIIKRNL